MKNLKNVLLPLLTMASLSASTYALDLNESTHDFASVENRINSEFGQCAGDSTSTGVVENCLYQSFDAWDAELNRVYKMLINRLDAGQIETLRVAQRQWIKFRDAEYETIDAMHQGKIGTMYALTLINSRMDLTINRVSQLSSRHHRLDN